jgi:hypothetical protein
MDHDHLSHALGLASCCHNHDALHQVLLTAFVRGRFVETFDAVPSRPSLYLVTLETTNDAARGSTSRTCERTNHVRQACRIRSIVTRKTIPASTSRIASIHVNADTCLVPQARIFGAQEAEKCRPNWIANLYSTSQRRQTEPSPTPATLQAVS